jgi:hypothetical protein
MVLMKGKEEIPKLLYLSVCAGHGLPIGKFVALSPHLKREGLPLISGSYLLLIDC